MNNPDYFFCVPNNLADPPFIITTYQNFLVENQTFDLVEYEESFVLMGDKNKFFK